MRKTAFYFRLSSLPIPDFLSELAEKVRVKKEGVEEEEEQDLVGEMEEEMVSR